jgi:hypothetical protein
MMEVDLRPYEDIFRQSVSWNRWIRDAYPTALFYLSQTFDNRVVVYYLHGDTIHTNCMDLSLDGLASKPDSIPTTLQSAFDMVRGPGIEPCWSFPGFDEKRSWSIEHIQDKGTYLQHQNHILLNVMGYASIDPETGTNCLTHFIIVYIDKVGKKIDWYTVPAPNNIKELATSNNIWMSKFVDTMGLKANL